MLSDPSLSGCPLTCVVKATNAFLCNVQPSPLSNFGFLFAYFQTTSDVTTRGCDFSCPGRPTTARNCSIRGNDGLPVELMEFSVERTESAEGESEQPEADESG